MQEKKPKKAKEKSFATKEAFIRWMNYKRRKVYDIYSTGSQLTVIFKDYEWL